MAILAHLDANHSQNINEYQRTPQVPAADAIPAETSRSVSSTGTQAPQRGLFPVQAIWTCGYEKVLLAVVVVLVLAAAFAGCSSIRKADEAPSDWFLVGTDAGRFVFRHSHKSYKAECSASMITGYPESLNHDCELLLYYINGKPLKDVNLVKEKLEVGSAQRKGSLYCVLRVTAIAESGK